MVMTNPYQSPGEAPDPRDKRASSLPYVALSYIAFWPAVAVVLNERMGISDEQQAANWVRLVVVSITCLIAIRFMAARYLAGIASLVFSFTMIAFTVVLANNEGPSSVRSTTLLFVIIGYLICGVVLVSPIFVAIRDRWHQRRSQQLRS